VEVSQGDQGSRAPNRADDLGRRHCRCCLRVRPGRSDPRTRTRPAGIRRRHRYVGHPGRAPRTRTAAMAGRPRIYVSARNGSVRAGSMVATGFRAGQMSVSSPRNSSPRRRARRSDWSAGRNRVIAGRRADRRSVAKLTWTSQTALPEAADVIDSGSWRSLKSGREWATIRLPEGTSIPDPGTHADPSDYRKAIQVELGTDGRPLLTIERFWDG
jgi:hypothetical protein